MLDYCMCVVLDVEKPCTRCIFGMAWALVLPTSAALTPPSDLIPAETNWDGCHPFPFFFFFFPNMTYTNKENKDVCG